MDRVSRAVALCIVVTYVSGFLIMSLNDSRYGFTDMNPLRPRILAAGGWLLLLLAVPFELIRQSMRPPAWRPELSHWCETGPLILAYWIETTPLLMWSSSVFNYDYGVASAGRQVDLSAPKIIMWLLFAILGVIAIYTLSENVPKKITSGLATSLVGYTLYSGAVQMFERKQFDESALSLWFTAVGILLEMRARNWKFRLGYWPRGIVMYLAVVSIFATNYYSHIKASYGGGALTPIQITFTKKFSPVQGQTINCMLIDETDAGLFVLGKNEKHATFIPRSSVAVVHFADSPEPSIFEPKSE